MRKRKDFDLSDWLQASPYIWVPFSDVWMAGLEANQEISLGLVKSEMLRKQLNT